MNYVSNIGNYRPEIDGLRAIAVLGVVINHAFPEALPGGFVGVDIFFVISGFLITRILLADIRSSKFSLWRFYCARAKRILPALVAMLVITTMLVAAIFTPPDFRSYAKTLISTATFTANFRFHSDSGYFEPDAKELPLLHMWSLSIEEQFYLIFPIALVICYRFGKIGSFLILCMFASLAAAEFKVSTAPTTAFYLPQYRVWEFCIGCLLATDKIRERPIPSPKLASLMGLCVIGLSFVLISSSTPFPGLTALPVCLGTALIIYSGSKSTGAALLTRPPLIWIGRISYSLYLWHWPILSVAFYANAGDLSTLDRAIALLLALLAAAISWRWIEQPFRGKNLLWSQQKIIASAACSLALLILAGLGIKAALDKAPVVLAFYGKTTADLMRDTTRLVTPKSCQPVENAVADPNCRIGNSALEPSIAIWGDSYADALKSGFSSVLREQSAVGLIMHSCPAILDTIRVDDRPAWRNFGPVCEAQNSRVMRELAENQALKTVIIFSSLNSAMFPYEPGAKLALKDMENLANEDVRQAIADRVVQTARSVAQLGKNVVLVGGFYAENRHGAIELLRAYRNDSSALEHATLGRTDYDRITTPLNSFLEESSRNDFEFVDPKSVFCKPGFDVCSFYDEGALLRDSGHLSVEGARRLSQLIADVLDRNHVAR